MKRREFLGLAAGAAAFNIGGVAFGQSRAKQIAAGRKIRVALIGCGGRMQSVLVTKCLDEEIVAMVDPDAPQMRFTRDRITKELFAPMASMEPAIMISWSKEALTLTAAVALVPRELTK